jgi:hypothetical protein
MAIDPLTEKLRSFAEAAQRLPSLRGGKPVNPSTVWRWTTRGIRARDGMLVRLESIKVGGTCCTSDEALLRFFRALSAGEPQSPTSVIAPSGPIKQPGEARESDRAGSPDNCGIRKAGFAGLPGTPSG